MLCLLPLQISLPSLFLFLYFKDVAEIIILQFYPSNPSNFVEFILGHIKFTTYFFKKKIEGEKSNLKQFLGMEIMF